MTGGAMTEIPEGINLRKEAQKIDLKQFDSSDVEHVIPIISVMRPPTGFRELKGNPAANNSINPQAIGQRNESKEKDTEKPVEEEATNYTKKKAEREANKQMDRYNRAWKRLRPEIDSPRETKLKIEENEVREDSSTILPSLHVNKRPNTQSSNHVRSHTVGARNNAFASSTTAR